MASRDNIRRLCQNAMLLGVGLLLSSLEAILPLTADRVMFRVRYTTEFGPDGKPVKAYGSAVPI